MIRVIARGELCSTTTCTRPLLWDILASDAWKTENCECVYGSYIITPESLWEEKDMGLKL